MARVATWIVHYADVADNYIPSISMCDDGQASLAMRRLAMRLPFIVLAAILGLLMTTSPQLPDPKAIDTMLWIKAMRT